MCDRLNVYFKNLGVSFPSLCLKHEIYLKGGKAYGQLTHCTACQGMCVGAMLLILWWLGSEKETERVWVPNIPLKDISSVTFFYSAPPPKRSTIFQWHQA
jgi:hypothetical protein